MRPPIKSSQQLKHEATVHAWKLLRRRFVLPPECFAHHTCVWTVLDTDIAACTVCGSVHICNHACPLLQTEDAEVCEITGYCVRPQNFVESCFSENIILEGDDSVQCNEKIREKLDSVEEIVNQALTSKLALTCYDDELAKVSARLRTKANEVIIATHSASEPFNLATIVEACARHLVDKPVSAFSLQNRKHLAEQCGSDILRAMTVSIQHFGMQLRDHEVHQFIIGLLYLMRRGVVMHGVWILPQRQELQDTLASENLLCKAMNLSTKCITDTENRFKFVYRFQTADKLSCFKTLYSCKLGLAAPKATLT